MIRQLAAFSAAVAVILIGWLTMCIKTAASNYDPDAWYE